MTRFCVDLFCYHFTKLKCNIKDLLGKKTLIGRKGTGCEFTRDVMASTNVCIFEPIDIIASDFWFDLGKPISSDIAVSLKAFFKRLRNSLVWQRTAKKMFTHQGFQCFFHFRLDLGFEQVVDETHSTFECDIDASDVRMAFLDTDCWVTTFVIS